MLPHRRRHFWSLNYYIFTCKIIRMNNVIFSLCAHLLFFSFLFYFLFRFFPCNSLNIFFPPGWPWLLHFLFVIGSCLTLLHPSSFVRSFVCLLSTPLIFGAYPNHQRREIATRIRCARLIEYGKLSFFDIEWSSICFLQWARPLFDFCSFPSPHSCVASYLWTRNPHVTVLIYNFHSYFCKKTNKQKKTCSWWRFDSRYLIFFSIRHIYV